MSRFVSHEVTFQQHNEMVLDWTPTSVIIYGRSLMWLAQRDITVQK